jgi:glycosyltransferase involved in cell wall biosynthesis
MKQQDEPRRILRVGHVVDCFGAGGIATGVLNLIRATAGEVDHTVISLSDDMRLLPQLDSEPGVCIIQPGLTRLFGFCSRLTWAVRRRRLDIIHCNNHFAWLDASLAARLAGCVCLQTFHGVERPLAEMPRDVRLKCRLAAAFGTAASAVGKASRAMICTLSGLPAETIEVIPNGIDLGRFRPSSPTSPERLLFRRELGIADETAVAIHAAGLRPIKDQATLLHAWGLVAAQARGSQQCPPLLLIAGEGECRRNLEELAQKLRIDQTVRFLGQRKDLPTLLPSCDLFVLSSLSEGLSFSLLEAMACGLPIVATDVGGNRELLIDGLTGFLVPPSDPQTLAGAMGRLLNDPHARAAFGRHGRCFVEEHHDLGKMAARYLSLYSRLMFGRMRRCERPMAADVPAACS